MKHSPAARFRAVVALMALILMGGMAMAGTASAGAPMNPSVLAWTRAVDGYQTNFTSAAAISLPQPGLHLGVVSLEATTKPGDFALTYDGISVAHFPCPSNGTTGQTAWAVDYVCGSTISSTIQVINGSVGAVYLTFFPASIGGPAISAYRAISGTVTFSATHSSLTAFTAVNFDSAPNVPKSLFAVCTVAGSTVYFQARGPLQLGYNCQLPVGGDNGAFIFPAAPLTSANSLTLYYTNTASAGTITWWAFY